MQHFRGAAVKAGMNAQTPFNNGSQSGDVIVRTPRAADTLGHVLRGAFVETVLPDDMLCLLRRLDRVSH